CVNSLRASRGRGIRVWGARNLAGQSIGVHRLFLSLHRLLRRDLASLVFEPNDPQLWARIERELSGRGAELFRPGALQVGTAADSFYARCDAELNPPVHRESGLVVAELGLAPARAGEFFSIQIVLSTEGVDVAGPVRLEDAPEEV